MGYILIHIADKIGTNFSMMCLRAIREHPIDSIDHVYMESGHSQMEVDSAHSMIERACRNVDIYCPTDYYQAVARARNRDPFHVEQLDITDVVDYKATADSYVRNRTKDSEKEKVKWLHIKWIRYEKASPNDIFFRYDYESEFRKMTVNVGSRG